MSPVELFLENEYLINYSSKRWFASTARELHEDIIGEARIGLWKACTTYRPDKGCKFATYAGKVINNQIGMFFRKDKIDTITLETEIGDGITLADTISCEIDYISDLDYEMVMQKVKKYKVLSMVVSGMTQDSIAEKLGFSQSYINKLLSKEKSRFKCEIGLA